MRVCPCVSAWRWRETGKVKEGETHIPPSISREGSGSSNMRFHFNYRHQHNTDMILVQTF